MRLPLRNWSGTRWLPCRADLRWSSEVGFQENKGLSELALAAVGTARDPIHRVFMKSLELVESDGRGEVVEVEVEWR